MTEAVRESILSDQYAYRVLVSTPHFIIASGTSVGREPGQDVVGYLVKGIESDGSEVPCLLVPEKCLTMPLGDYHAAMQAVRDLAQCAPVEWQRLFVATVQCQFRSECRKGEFDAVQMIGFIMDAALVWSIQRWARTPEESRPWEVWVNSLGAFFVTVGVAARLLQDYVHGLVRP